MNNFKKIGLTALAGSLAVTSANAVDYALSGVSNLSQSKSMKVFQTEAIAGNQYCFNGLGNWSTTNRLGEL
jgi:hypothetical protein